MSAARIALALTALALAIAGPVAAQPSEPVGPVERLAAAAAAAEEGAWDRVERLAAPVAGTVATGERAEAHRLLGLAAYHTQRLEQAEAHFLAYLKLDLDGRLDPSLYAPELVAFFENVRATHAAELRALRPRPRRAALLNLLPPAGQFQNRQPVKGWILGGLGAGLLATNLTTYVVLDRWCSDGDRTCERDGRSRSSTARTLVDVNYWSGIALIGLYTYGVLDGFRHYRRNPHVTITPVTFSDGTGVAIRGSF